MSTHTQPSNHYYLNEVTPYQSKVSGILNHFLSTSWLNLSKEAHLKAIMCYYKEGTPARGFKSANSKLIPTKSSNWIMYVVIYISFHGLNWYKLTHTERRISTLRSYIQVIYLRLLYVVIGIVFYSFNSLV